MQTTDLKNNIKRMTVVCGHYGSGKTEFSLNLALYLKSLGLDVTIIDFDIVNPYYRTKDAESLLLSKGIDVISPDFANSNIETPTLPPDILRAFEDKDRYIVFDVGGDDDGAVPLGAYYDKFSKEDHAMLFVLNERRMLTSDAEGAMKILADIEYASRLKFTGIVNDTHLMRYTDIDIIDGGLDLARELSQKTNLPLVCTCVEKEFLDKNKFIKNDPEKYGCIFPIDLYVGPKFDK